MLSIPAKMVFENFVADSLIDAKGRYRLELDPALPLSIKAFSFHSRAARPRLNWHERLEIFVAVQGNREFKMGNQAVQLRRGDIVIVENMKPHGLEVPGDGRCLGITISFLPELVYNPGSPACNFALLVPFLSHSNGPLVVRGKGSAVAPIHRAINRLLHAYFNEVGNLTGCYLYLLEILYCLSRHFNMASVDHAEYVNQQQRIKRLARLLEYIQANYAENIPVEKGARMAAMSESRFIHYFKKSAGMTFVSYLTHLRINAAAEMLCSTEESISDIAAATGFSDQSYFGRVFRKQFGISPFKFRLRPSR